MSAPLRAISAAFRRKLLSQPGITELPVCGMCGRETDARNFDRELCKACEAERAAVSEAWEAERHAEANLGASFPVPEDPMFGSDEAAKPFLPEDENLEVAQNAGHERKEVWTTPTRALADEHAVKQETSLAPAEDLTEAQKVMVRERIYFPRYAGNPPVRRDKCRHAVTQLRQCDRNPTTTRDGWAVCPRHATTGGFPTHSAIGR